MRAYELEGGAAGLVHPPEGAERVDPRGCAFGRELPVGRDVALE